MGSSEATRFLLKTGINEPVDLVGAMNHPLPHQACQAPADLLEALCPWRSLWADIWDGWPATDNGSSSQRKICLEELLRGEFILGKDLLCKLHWTLLELAIFGNSLFQVLLGLAACFFFFSHWIAILNLHRGPKSPTELRKWVLRPWLWRLRFIRLGIGAQESNLPLWGDADAGGGLTAGRKTLIWGCKGQLVPLPKSPF